MSKRRRGERQRTDQDREPIKTENRWLHRDTAQQTQIPRIGEYTGRHSNEYVLISTSKEMIKVIQPAMGHEIDTNESEQGGEQMPIPACCDAQKGKQVEGAAGRTRGVPRTARASSKPCNRSDGAETETGTEREAPNRFGSTSSSPREIPSSLSTPSFYSSSSGRFAFNSSPTESTRFDPRMYLIRP